MSVENMATHLQMARYGEFWLTDAIRPSPKLPVVPHQGYRVERYRDEDTGLNVPVLAAAVSREKLFDLFLDLLDPLGEVVVGSSRVDLQACKLEYSIVSPK